MFFFQSWKQYRESRFKKTVAEITMNILIHQIIPKQALIKGGLISEGILLSDPQNNKGLFIKIRTRSVLTLLLTV